MNTQLKLKNRVITLRETTHRLWKMKSLSQETQTAYEVSYAKYEQLWHIYKDLHGIELKCKPSRKVETYEFSK